VTHTLVVASGGLDSTTALAYYAARRHQLSAVTVDYGQRHRREVDAARLVAEHYGARHYVVEVPGLAAVLTGSALTDASVDVPSGHYADESMRSTVVPNRNAILANIAIGVAVAQKADVVALGVHAGDHPVYPDCRPEWVAALASLTAVGNDGYHIPRIEAPFVHAGKHEVAAIADALGAPVHLSWSCYRGGDLHCGACGTCVERREAFTLAGVPDPTRYAELST
jgi:7-cyano-7-deazaguanine synthase